MQHVLNFFYFSDNNDFIVLQSSQVDETIGIKNEYINKGDNIDFHSKSLPFALTGLKESLKDAQMNGLCLSPFTVRRFDYSVTGIQCLKVLQHLKFF